MPPQLLWFLGFFFPLKVLFVGEFSLCGSRLQKICADVQHLELSPCMKSDLKCDLNESQNLEKVKNKLITSPKCVQAFK